MPCGKGELPEEGFGGTAAEQLKVCLEVKMRVVDGMNSYLHGARTVLKENKEDGFIISRIQLEGKKDCGSVDTGEIQHSRILGKAPPNIYVCSVSMLARVRCKILIKAAGILGMKTSPKWASIFYILDTFDPKVLETQRYFHFKNATAGKEKVVLPTSWKAVLILSLTKPGAKLTNIRSHL